MNDAVHMCGLLTGCKLGGKSLQRLQWANVTNILLSLVHWWVLHQGHIPVSTLSNKVS